MFFNEIISPLEHFIWYKLGNYHIYTFLIYWHTIVLGLGIVIIWVVYTRNIFFISKMEFIINISIKFINNLLFINFSKKYFQLLIPFFYTIFIFIFFSNLFGFLPYSFSVTTELSVILILSLFIYSSINIFSYEIYNDNMLTLFLPKNLPLSLQIILIPLELLSYLFRLLSLPVRLFANMLAGHTLLLIFGVTLSGIFSLNFFFLTKFICYCCGLSLLFLLLYLEFLIVFIQTYVFMLLINIYLKECICLH